MIIVWRNDSSSIKVFDPYFSLHQLIFYRTLHFLKSRTWTLFGLKGGPRVYFHGGFNTVLERGCHWEGQSLYYSFIELYFRPKIDIKLCFMLIMLLSPYPSYGGHECCILLLIFFISTYRNVLMTCLMVSKAVKIK